MNRTQLLSLGSALGLTLKKSSTTATAAPPTTTASAPIDVVVAPGSKQQQQQHRKEILEDEIGPLTASPPASPATRLSSSSASFFPTSNPSRNGKQLPLKDLNRIGSFATHSLPKLRESKWFSEGEARIFCVVAEIGFIVEIRRAVEAAGSGAGGAKEFKSLFGVVTKKECINQSAEGE